MIKFENGSSKFFGDKVETKSTTQTLSDTVAVLKREFESARTYAKYDSLMKASNNFKASGIVLCAIAPLSITAGALFIARENNSLNSDFRGIILGLSSVLIIAGATELILGPIWLSKSKKLREEAELSKGKVSMSVPSLRLSLDNSGKSVAIGTKITF